MPYLGTFGLEFENTIVIFEMCTLEFVQVKNFAKKQKCLNLVPKCLIWVLLGQNLKKLLSYLISALSNFSDKFLTQTVNFDIESTFSKGPGSGFSEGPGLGPGPPYKVCFKNGVLNDWVLFLS